MADDPLLLTPLLEGAGPSLLLAEEQGEPEQPRDVPSAAAQVAAALAEARSGDSADGAPYQEMS